MKQERSEMEERVKRDVRAIAKQQLLATGEDPEGDGAPAPSILNLIVTLRDREQKANALSEERAKAMETLERVQRRRSLSCALLWPSRERLPLMRRMRSSPKFPSFSNASLSEIRS